MPEDRRPRLQVEYPLFVEEKKNAFCGSFALVARPRRKFRNGGNRTNEFVDRKRHEFLSGAGDAGTEFSGKKRQKNSGKTMAPILEKFHFLPGSVKRHEVDVASGERKTYGAFSAVGGAVLFPRFENVSEKCRIGFRPRFLQVFGGLRKI